MRRTTVENILQHENLMRSGAEITVHKEETRFSAGLIRKSFVLSILVAAFQLLAAATAIAQLSVGISIHPEQPRVGEQISVQVTVSNQDSLPRSSVVLEVDLPPGIEDFAESLITGGPNSISCSPGVSNVCASGEFIQWSLGHLEPGESRTVTLPPIVAPVVDGTNISFVATVIPSTGLGVAVAGQATVDDLRLLELAIDALASPVGPGEDLVYTLHYGNTSIVDVATNAILRLTPPAGTSFVAASDLGSELIDGTIEWNLGDIQPAQNGQREVTLSTNSGLVDGTLLVTSAELTDASALPLQVRANALHEVDADEPLGLALSVNPDPARVGELLAVTATVTNQSAIAQNSVVLEIRLPEGIDDFAESLITGGPNSISCSQGVSNVCASGEFIQWSLGHIEPGESRTVTLPPIVAAIANGELIDFRAFARTSATQDHEATATRTVPEPGTTLLLVCGVMGLAFLRRARL